MKRLKELGAMLLGIWLVVTGAVSLFDIHVANLSLVMDLLAIAAGALILMKR